jgi:hypothetical protein
MQTPTVKMVPAAAAALGTVPALAGAPTALTATGTGQLGDQIELADGPMVQQWPVTGLRPSTDRIPYPIGGRLWDATATRPAAAGTDVPG